MFTANCPHHGSEVLIWPSGIDGARNFDGQVEVAFHCTCGARGTLMSSGAHQVVVWAGEALPWGSRGLRELEAKTN